MEERGFQIPPGRNAPTNRPCSTLAECRRLYEEHKEQYTDEMQRGEGGQGEMIRPYPSGEDRSMMKFFPSEFQNQNPSFEDQYQEYKPQNQGQYQDSKPMPGEPNYQKNPPHMQYEEPPPGGGLMQYQQPGGGVYQPPTGSYQPPTGEYRPPENYQSAPSSNYIPPSSFEGSYEPTSLSPARTFVAAVSVIVNLLLGF